MGAFALLAGACGGDDDGGSAGSVSTASAGDEPTSTDGDNSGGCTGGRPSGELAFGIGNEPLGGFDPIGPTVVGVAGGNELAAVFDTLMQYDSETGEFVPRMAESLESNGERTKWTLTVREGITFGSGAPVDTEAVKYTVNLHKAPDTPSLAKPLASLIESMQIVDDRTMVFHLTEPWGNFPSLLAGNVGMVIDPGEWERLGPEAFAADPKGAGAGPYRLLRWVSGEEIVMEAKDDYWGGPVCTKTLRFVRIEDNEARYEALVNGDVDAAFIRSAQDAADAREQGLNIASQTQNGGMMLMINNGARGQNRPGEDPRVRQAIAYALDPEVIDQRFTGGVGLPDSALVPETSLLYTDDIEALPYDPERARELLEEAKADIGYDGSLQLLCNTAYADAAIAIEGLLEAAGFEVDNDSTRSVQDWIQVITETTDYDITCHSLSMTDAQPWEKLQLAIGGGDLPTTLLGYVNADMDDAMDTLREAATVRERQAALADVQRVWNETVPSAVYSHVEENVVWNDNVEGLDFTLESIALFNQARVID